LDGWTCLTAIPIPGRSIKMTNRARLGADLAAWIGRGLVPVAPRTTSGRH
jgi:hypothetical protein